MRGRGIARSVADGPRQQLDRRESDAIIAGQLAFAIIIGAEGSQGGLVGAQGVLRDVLARGISIICTNVYMNDRADRR